MIQNAVRMLVAIAMLFTVAACGGSADTVAGTDTGLIAVTSTPAGAKILIDRIDSGQVTPATLLAIPIGGHTVQLTLTGYGDVQQDVTITKDATANVDLTLLAVPPSVPTNLTSVGSLDHIVLTWTASTGDGLEGYNIYRSDDDGATFVKLNDVPVTETTYDDAIASPAGDGVFYLYEVSAMGTTESADSGSTRNIHGTRLASDYPTGFTTIAAESPYVVEGTTIIDSGNFMVDTGTKLYVLDNGIMDLDSGTDIDLANGKFTVKGLLRVLASASAHATFTSHKAGGGALAAGEGFTLIFNGATSYNAVDGSGTLIQNTDVQNLREGLDPLEITSCAPRFENSKLTANNQNKAVMFGITTGAIFSHCSITGIYPSIQAVLSTTTFKIEKSVIHPGIHNYTLDFENVTNPIASGQISNNAIDRDAVFQDQIDLSNIGGSDIPLGNNYWTNDVPTFRRQGTTPGGLVCTYAPQLSAAPADVGTVGW